MNEEHPRTLRFKQAVTFLGVVIPFIGLVVAIALLWGQGVGWIELSLLAGMYLAAGLGITVGYHRLFVHRSFRTTKAIEFILAVLGSMALQGPLLRWAAVHRRHHQHSDTAEDPHSPHCYGTGIRSVLLGWWHAHIGWMFSADPPDLVRYVRDLRSRPLLRAASSLFPLWAFLGLAIPAALGGLFTGTWTGVFLGFLWGGLVRLCLGHHVTWSINSVCHLWGYRPFKVLDESRNNFIFGVLALGEGWHNNHHAFPSSARHGLRWWQVDFSYLVILLLERLGLAWSVRLPTPAAMARRQASAASNTQARFAA